MGSCETEPVLAIEGSSRRPSDKREIEHQASAQTCEYTCPNRENNVRSKFGITSVSRPGLEREEKNCSVDVSSLSRGPSHFLWWPTQSVKTSRVLADTDGNVRDHAIFPTR